MKSMKKTKKRKGQIVKNTKPGNWRGATPSMLPGSSQCTKIFLAFAWEQLINLVMKVGIASHTAFQNHALKSLYHAIVNPVFYMHYRQKCPSLHFICYDKIKFMSSISPPGSVYLFQVFFIGLHQMDFHLLKHL